MSLRLATALLLAAAGSARADGPGLERVVIDTKFPGAYQVETADVNGDGKPDVIAVGGNTCAWFENPTWTKHVVTTGTQTPGIISSATHDIDGDGTAEIAIAYEFSMNQPTKGKLLLAKAKDKTGTAWTTTPIDDIGSIHRLRWADVDGDGAKDLAVGPIFGPKATPPLFGEDPARLVVYRGLKGSAPTWTKTPVGDRLITHAIDAVDIDGNGRAEILAACVDGIVAYEFDPKTETFAARTLSTGKPGTRPKTGSSEVHVGKLKDGSRFTASIDPWHGGEVSVHRPIKVRAADGESKPTREVIDATLEDGHALWVSDVDGDGNDEVFAGHRGKDHRVSMYWFEGGKWNRRVLDSGIAAQDLRGADFNGDGKPDVVAVGGKTANVVIFLSK